MARSYLSLSFAALLISVPLLRADVEYVTNGGFENASTFSGWALSPGEGVIQKATTPNVSPFSGPYGPSLASAQLIDGVQIFSDPNLSQVLGPTNGPLQLSFDFKLAAFAEDFWQLAVFKAFGPGSYVTFSNIFIGNGGNFTFIYNPGGPRFSTPIIAGTWYHVNVDFDFSGQKASGNITPFGGPTVAWAPGALANSPTGIDMLEFLDTQSTTAKNGDLFLDNISVHGPLVIGAVPEPATYGLVAAGLLAGLALIRRRR